MNKNENLKDILIQVMIATIYVVLVVVSMPLSFGSIQFRLAEILMILVLFNKKHTIGITLGCLIANLFSPMLAFDIVFGTLATLISCVLMSLIRIKWISLLIPVIVNAFIIGAGLYWFLEIPFWINVGFVALGEFAVVYIIGIITYTQLQKNSRIIELLS